MSPSDWQVRRQGWTSQETAGAYDERRFSSPAGRRKQANDVARLCAALSRFLPGDKVDAPPTVLDLPCGTGRLHAPLAAAGYRVFGADLSAAMLCAGGAPAGSSAMLLAEAERLPLADNSADAVLSLRFLFHIRDASARRRILSEMARVTRHVVIGQVRDPRSLKHRLRRARRALHLPVTLREPALDRVALGEELAAAGLELLDILPISRLFSDKTLFVARPFRTADGRSAD
jgi:SAM-dependent methyltransferase